MDFESTAIEYRNIEMIVNSDDTKKAENERKIEAVNYISEEIQVLSINNIKRYKKYRQDQIERFIHLKQEEGLSILKAAAQCGIPRSTAYELINEFNSSDGTVLPGNMVVNGDSTEHVFAYVQWYNIHGDNDGRRFVDPFLETWCSSFRVKAIDCIVPVHRLYGQVAVVKYGAQRSVNARTVVISLPKKLLA
ncbi:hypothetical protein INT45_014152 [Circinella minor]|uniref:Uncharacterized protein n=1 Tax=Circinella minor TaxID=1195481 RepID=A0A8H7RIE2_9FUNG|nr:hypothetical protein INT45_014152 [Circinella minor]